MAAIGHHRAATLSAAIWDAVFLVLADVDLPLLVVALVDG